LHEIWGNEEVFGLARGGVYKIERLGMPPLYFTFPWNKNFWYDPDPDMRVVANANYDSTCNTYDENGNVSMKGIIPEYNNYGSNDFAKEPGSDFSYIVFEKDRNIVITTDFDEINDFWNNEANFWVAFGGNNEGPNRSARVQFDLSNDITTPPYNLAALPFLGEIKSLRWNKELDEDLYNSNINPNTGNIDLLVELQYQQDDAGSTITHHYEEISIDTNGNVGGRYFSIFLTTNKWLGYRVRVYAL